MVSKIWEALNFLGINFSDIGTNRQHNFNWRHSYSLWGNYPNLFLVAIVQATRLNNECVAKQPIKINKAEKLPRLLRAL